jgi:DNA-binding CsgD family transcriptional regulator
MLNFPYQNLDFTYMKKNLTAFLFIFISCYQLLLSQVYTLNESDWSEIKDFQVLADEHYNFDKILNDSTLPFSNNHKIDNFQKYSYYWYKCTIENPSPYTQTYYVQAFPLQHFTLYHYDAEKEKWISAEAGAANSRLSRRSGILPCIFQGKQKNVLYFKVRVADLAQYPFSTNAKLWIEKASYYEAQEQLIFVSWAVTMGIMLMFLLYNAYIYFIFKDKTYLYYLLIVAGGMLYITSINHFLNLFLPFHLDKTTMEAKGCIHSWGTDSFGRELGILLVITGFLQFTRHYLQTFEYLPKWDKILVKVNILFLISLSCLTLYNFTYANHYCPPIENCLILSILLLLFYVGGVSYRQKFKPAKYFLLANALPLLIMILITGYLILHPKDIKTVLFLPNISILGQALTFAVALVARINVLKEELKERQLEAQNLKNENEQMQLRAKVIELENENIMAEMALEKEHREKLQEKLDFNNRELASITLHIYQKNEMLLDLQKKIETLPQTPVHATSLKLIKNTIQNNLYLEADWEKFRLHFEQVHPDFFKDLLAKHPNLTAYEVRLCAYLHIQLSTKEIASLLNINPASVLTAKTRLNKKMNLIGKENLGEQSLN